MICTFFAIPHILIPCLHLHRCRYAKISHCRKILGADEVKQENADDQVGLGDHASASS